MKGAPGGSRHWKVGAGRTKKLVTDYTSGFTIVEVLMVLAISATMIVASSIVFTQTRENSYFSQGMYDLQSQFQSMANNVSSQNVSNFQAYTCSPALISGVMRPVLNTPGSGTNQDCILLGLAVQTAVGNTTLNLYPVFGLKDLYVGNNDTNTLSATVTDSHPAPSIDPSNTIIDALKFRYTLLNGLKVVSAKYSGADSYLLTMFSSLQSNNSSGNEIDFMTYPITGSASNPDAQTLNCIEANACLTSGTAATNTAWNLCVEYSGKQGQLNVKATPTGISTKLNMNGCT
jgi:prepilin-type N-terminal cleavage/methylation domain-containing protein